MLTNDLFNLNISYHLFILQDEVEEEVDYHAQYQAPSNKNSVLVSVSSLNIKCFFPQKQCCNILNIKNKFEQSSLFCFCSSEASGRN